MGLKERMKRWEGCGRPRRCSASQASPDYYAIRPTERNFLICTETFFKRASFLRESKIALLVRQVTRQMEGATCRHRSSRAAMGRSQAMSWLPGTADSHGSRAQGHGPDVDK